MNAKSENKTETETFFFLLRNPLLHFKFRSTFKKQQTCFWQGQKWGENCHKAIYFIFQPKMITFEKLMNAPNLRSAVSIHNYRIASTILLIVYSTHGSLDKQGSLT